MSKIDISLGGRSISDLQTTHHPYKAYLECIMSYSSTARASQLRCVGFFPDKEGAYESYGFPNLIANLNKPGIGGNSDNRGFIDRRERTERSKVQETCWPLHSDFFQISQYW